MKPRFTAFQALSAAAILLTVPSAARSEMPIERAIQKTSVGASAEIGHHARWNASCAALTAPTVTIERPPGHGSVCLSTGPVRPVISRTGVALNCVGRAVQGLHVVYSPNFAFTGVDTLRYGLDAPEGHVSRDVSITIEPAGGETLSGPAPASDEAQAPGPMPECPRPTS